MMKLTIAALAGTALLASAPALAKPGGGQGGGHGGHGGSPSGPPTTTGQGSGMGGMNNPGATMGPTNASPTATERASPNSPVSTTTTTTTDPTTTGTSQREDARTNSQGPDNASTTGIANANENSVLASGSVAAETLPGLNTGLTVRSSTGADLGTVSEVVTGTDGSIRLIVVTSETGETIRIPATSLSISGDVVTTTTP